MNTDASPVLPELPPTYYLDNFAAFLGDVCRRYGHLLNAGESAFAETFFSLEKNAQ